MLRPYHAHIMEVPLKLTYRHWFMITLMILVNVIIFGCMILAVTGKIFVG